LQFFNKLGQSSIKHKTGPQKLDFPCFSAISKKADVKFITQLLKKCLKRTMTANGALVLTDVSQLSQVSELLFCKEKKIHACQFFQYQLE